MWQKIWQERREKAIYHPGQKVELKHRLGFIDTVIAYDPSTVPPIRLEIDPQPRYPEELNVISQTEMLLKRLKLSARGRNSQASIG